MRRAAVAALAACALAAPAAAFAPADPLAPEQWYLNANHTYDAWPVPPAFAPVKIGIVDSGIDGSHPELTEHVVAARSFVGGRPTVDTEGHGTFVAGEIAATVGDGIGIAGLFPAAQLIVAKVVDAKQLIPLGAEAKAIRWVVDQGAQVINLSLGGLRDPRDPRRDTFSQAEADAVAYAVAHGVVVVAAAGNGDEAPSEPWRYASYPAALPHVLGVGALAQGGAVPAFSNRDAVYVDLAAPGENILSTFPLALTARTPGCTDQGYSDCGPQDYQDAEGTSFAAPQVTAAAAMLLSLDPALRPDQVTAVLERAAVDVSRRTGCPVCRVGRDAFSGWGRLDVAKAVAALRAPLPQADAYEPNDDAGPRAHALAGSTTTVRATLDYWDDPVDVYRIRLARGQRLFSVLGGPLGAQATLALWGPGAAHVDDPRERALRLRASTRHGGVQRLSYRAPATGAYDLEVRLGAPGAGPYTLELSRG